MLRFLFSVIPSKAEGSPRSDFLSVIPSQAELMDPAQPRISQVNIRAFRRARFFGLRPANIVATIALGWRPDQMKEEHYDKIDFITK